MKKSLLKALTIFIVFSLICYYFDTKSPDSSYYVNTEFATTVNALNKIHPQKSSTLRIMSYNLLADTPGFMGSPAYLRSADVCFMLNTLKPDVTGFQEVSRNWAYCLNRDTDYNFISPLKTNFMGTMTIIMYNKDTLLLCQWGEYVFEKTHDGNLRCAVWGVFKEKATEKSFIVINTHLSLSYNEKDTAIKQAQEILDLAHNLYAEYNYPLFFTGDFNSGIRYSGYNASSCVYEVLCTSLTDTLRLAQQKSHGENLSTSSHSVDHIFVKGEPDVKEYVILSQPYFKNLSDHYPIFIDFTL
jgi:endonuclease/exonuclease/phosphatase (EEP) superfamily protein YafD